VSNVKVRKKKKERGENYSNESF